MQMVRSQNPQLGAELHRYPWTEPFASILITNNSILSLTKDALSAGQLASKAAALRRACSPALAVTGASVDRLRME